MLIPTTAVSYARTLELGFVARHLRRARAAEGVGEEGQHDVLLAPQLAQREAAAIGGLQGEVWRFVADVEDWRLREALFDGHVNRSLRTRTVFNGCDVRTGAHADLFRC